MTDNQRPWIGVLFDGEPRPASLILGRRSDLLCQLSGNEFKVLILLALRAQRLEPLEEGQELFLQPHERWEFEKLREAGVLGNEHVGGIATIVTASELAADSGLTRETVDRLLGKLERAGLIELRPLRGRGLVGRLAQGVLVLFRQDVVWEVPSAERGVL